MYPFIEVSETPTFGNCVLHSPFIVAIGSTTPTDSEVLEVLGLSHYRAGWLRGRSSSKEVLITNAGEWTLVADDWHYTIWHADNVWDAAVESSSYNDRRVRRDEGMPLPGDRGAVR